MKNEKTSKLTSAAGTSEVSEETGFTTSVGVSEIEETAVKLLLGKGGQLLSASGLEVPSGLEATSLRRR